MIDDHSPVFSLITRGGIDGNLSRFLLGITWSGPQN